MVVADRAGTGLVDRPPVSLVGVDLVGVGRRRVGGCGVGRCGVGRGGVGGAGVGRFALRPVVERPGALGLVALGLAALGLAALGLAALDLPARDLAGARGPGGRAAGVSGSAARRARVVPVEALVPVTGGVPVVGGATRAAVVRPVPARRTGDTGGRGRPGHRGGTRPGAVADLLGVRVGGVGAHRRRRGRRPALGRAEPVAGDAGTLRRRAVGGPLGRDARPAGRTGVGGVPRTLAGSRLGAGGGVGAGDGLGTGDGLGQAVGTGGSPARVLALVGAGLVVAAQQVVDDAADAAAGPLVGAVGGAHRVCSSVVGAWCRPLLFGSPWRPDRVS
ncbi:hypothetical protein H6H00_17540 [Pseudonocardia petroleophila]|uniref:Uncharacterized protein n=1 Tax=Pseudonocardia petroleophila TaxID=37331 RepID=A0A7G7MBB5_9PSEU|nr:hypothetical protein H6H00_17540 [Pseudonocardia petroleophila]